MEKETSQMQKIPLSRGKVALVDDEDLPRLLGLKWHVRRDPDTGILYAQHCYVIPKANGSKGKGAKRKTITMHRLILGVTGKLKVDHKDRNGLNNQKENLRLATNGQNQGNRRQNRNNTTGFKGVSFLQKSRKFRANAGNRYLGDFSDAREAALVYDRAAMKHFGKYALTNRMLGNL